MGACSSKGGSGNQGLSNQTNINKAKEDVKNIIFNKNDTSKEISITNQSIHVTEDWPPGMMDSRLFSRDIVTRDWLGQPSNRPAFGCGYSIIQDTDSKISSISSDIMDNVDEIYHTVKENIKKSVNAQMTGNNKGEKQVNDAIDKSEDDIKENITNNLNKLLKEQKNDTQEIHIVNTTPPACDNEGQGPILNQRSRIEITSQDIINSAISMIDKNLEEAGISSNLETTDTSMSCNIQLGISACVCCIILIIVIYFINQRSEDSGSSDALQTVMAKAVPVPP